MVEGESRRVLIYEAVSGGGMGPGEPVASWLQEGAAIRRSIVSEFAALPGVHVVEPVDSRCLDPLPSFPNVTRILVDPRRPVDLARLAHRADLAVLVAPETGGCLESLAMQCAASGIRSLGSTPEAIALCADKLRLAEHLARAGIPTPPTRPFRIDADLPGIESHEGLVVVKPVDGAGAVDTFVLDPTSFDFGGLGSDRSLLIQPYRPGPAFSASFLLDRAGRAQLIAIGRQQVRVGPGGRVSYDGGELPVQLDQSAIAPVRAAVESVSGLRGFVGVDFIRVEPDKVIEVIEINPRLTTSIVGLFRLLPPGTIARAWLAGMLDSEGAVPDHDFLAIRRAATIRFRADGSIRSEPGGAR